MAQAPKSGDLTATVNDAAVQGQCMLLSGEICLTGNRLLTSKALVNKCLGSFDSIDKGERTRWKPRALCWITNRVIKQKSAEGIVARNG